MVICYADQDLLKNIFHNEEGFSVERKSNARSSFIKNTEQIIPSETTLKSNSFNMCSNTHTLSMSAVQYCFFLIIFLPAPEIKM